MASATVDPAEAVEDQNWVPDSMIWLGLTGCCEHMRNEAADGSALPLFLFP